MGSLSHDVVSAAINKDFNVIESIVHIPCDQRVLDKAVQDRQNPVEIQFLMNPSQMAKAQHGHASDTWIRIFSKLDTAILNPVQLGVVIGQTEQGVNPSRWNRRDQIYLSLGSRD